MKHHPDAQIDREWLVTNGLGGYASATVAGVMTRRYHGILVAALPAPLGRTILLNHLWEEVTTHDGAQTVLGTAEFRDVFHYEGVAHLVDFSLDHGLPVWRYEFGATVIEKRILMPRLQNTTYISYHVVRADGPVTLRLKPSVHFRNYGDEVSAVLHETYSTTVTDGRYEVVCNADFPPLRMRVNSAGQHLFHPEPIRSNALRYRTEGARGYDAEGAVWTPGVFEIPLDAGGECTLVASAEPWDVIEALSPAEALQAELERRLTLVSLVPGGCDDIVTRQLVYAADQFIIVPSARREDAARAAAAGDEARTVIAGYHWFTDWGRDTMISLEGLTLATGRWREAGYILRTFGHYVRDGLIPNMFPDQSTSGLYHTADASLWFFHALHRYLAMTADMTTRDTLLPAMRSTADHHLKGTLFGIRVDPADGLLTQGQEGYQLTWMDAKVDGWVVTPRRGKAVEVNALWYNALRLLSGWLADSDAAAARRYAEHAERTRVAFNQRFWNEQTGCLFDVIDGPDGNEAKIRPNQVFAVALDHPVLDRSRWEDVVRVVQERLLTPVGLRSLEPNDPQYESRYYGDLRARDAAYHQGTVWGWLIGPFIDAWLRVHPERAAEAQQMLDGLIDHMDEFGVGSIAEIFDAEPPFQARGCIAQAWSVAEVLRCRLRLTQV